MTAGLEDLTDLEKFKVKKKKNNQRVTQAQYAQMA